VGNGHAARSAQPEQTRKECQLREQCRESRTPGAKCLNTQPQAAAPGVASSLCRVAVQPASAEVRRRPGTRRNRRNAVQPSSSAEGCAATQRSRMSRSPQVRNAEPKVNQQQCTAEADTEVNPRADPREPRAYGGRHETGGVVEVRHRAGAWHAVATIRHGSVGVRHHATARRRENARRNHHGPAVLVRYGGWACIVCGRGRRQDRRRLLLDVTIAHKPNQHANRNTSHEDPSGC